MSGSIFVLHVSSLKFGLKLQKKYISAILSVPDLMKTSCPMEKAAGNIVI